jgi:hypothetical protein
VWRSYGHDGVVGQWVSDITVFPVTSTTSAALRLLKSVQDSRHGHHYTRNKGTNITPRLLKLAHEGCVHMCVFMSQGVGGFSNCSHHPKYLLAGKTSQAFFTSQTCVQDPKTFLQFVVNSIFLNSRTDLIGHELWLCSTTE